MTFTLTRLSPPPPIPITATSIMSKWGNVFDKVKAQAQAAGAQAQQMINVSADGCGGPLGEGDNKAEGIADRDG